MPYWRKYQDIDGDFKTILMGFSIGVRSPNNFLMDHVISEFRSVNLIEKSDIDTGAWLDHNYTQLIVDAKKNSRCSKRVKFRPIRYNYSKSFIRLYFYLKQSISWFFYK